MDVDVLGVFVVSEEWLGVFPAVEACDFSERGLDDVVQGFALSVAVDGALDVGWLDLSTMEDNSTGFIDERLPMSANNVIIHKLRTDLCNVKRAPVSLTVSQNDKNTRLADSSSDLVHLGRLPLKGVFEILVDPSGVFNR